MENKEKESFSDKILKGCQLAFEKLLAQEKLIDGELVFAEKNGTIVHIKAREFEAYKKKKESEK